MSILSVFYKTSKFNAYNVSGIGESVATKTKDNGESTSVFKFSSDNKLSIIKQGSGYWKYKPEADGIKFYTGYDYETRWGVFGQFFDKIIFRPLMTWATAWSFDNLKIWIEQGLNPKQTIKAQITVLISNLILGVIWIYQGLIPKILFADSGELEILKSSGIFDGNEKSFLTLIGIGEILFGIAILFFFRKTIHYFNIIALIILASGAFLSNKFIFTLPFNPFSLNIAMIALSIIVILNLDNLPKASNCITKQNK